MKEINLKLGLKELIGIILIVILISFGVSTLENSIKFRFGSVVLVDTLSGDLKVGDYTVKSIYANEYFGNYLKLLDNNVPDSPHWLYIYYALQNATFTDELNTVFDFQFDGNNSVLLDSCGVTIQNAAGTDYLKITDVFSQSGDSSGVYTADGIIKLKVNGVDRYIQLYK
jgi:hypothetical protein